MGASLERLGTAQRREEVPPGLETWELTWVPSLLLGNLRKVPQPPDPVTQGT